MPTPEENSTEGQGVLTLNGEHNLGGPGLGAQLVPRLAPEPRVVVLRRRDEGVRVPALAARRRVGLVGDGVVPVPDHLGEWVAAGGGAHQGDGLAEADRLALDVAGDLGRAGRVCKTEISES